MNCDQFQSHLTQLVRDEPMDSRLQADCHAHAEACHFCQQQKLESERLQRLLSVLAREDERCEAPEAIEEQLRAAFRRRHQVAASSLSHRRLATSRIGLAMAATVLIIAGVTWQLWPRSEVVPASILASTSKPNPASTSQHEGRNNISGPLPINKSARKSSLKSGSTRIPALYDLEKTKVTGSGRSEPLPVDGSDGTEEALTGYLLLNPGQRYYPMERGQLLRVTVPRSTLGSFGFPVNPERAMMPVRADLLVGEDGMARAIRFIK